MGESRAGIAVGPSSISWRLVAGAALGVAVLYFASVAVGSLVSLPGTDASPARVLAFFIDHREGFLAAVVLNGIAWCLFAPPSFAVWMAAIGVSMLRRGPELVAADA